MCTNGASPQGLGQMIDQVDEQAALVYRWSHKLAHAAEDVGQLVASARLHSAQTLLDEARALLSEAKISLEDNQPADEVSVKLL